MRGDVRARAAAIPAAAARVPEGRRRRRDQRPNAPRALCVASRADSSFYNQRLKAWHPILTPKWVIVSFTIVGIVFIPIGIALLVASNSVRRKPLRRRRPLQCTRANGRARARSVGTHRVPPLVRGLPLVLLGPQVVEYVKQYDGEGATEAACKIGAGENRTCTITFDVTEEMKAPVYVYYELDNFYQNHRRYVKSRSDAQLKGELLSEGDLTDCDPLVTAADGKVLHPCGLIANSFFNGTSSPCAQEETAALRPRPHPVVARVLRALRSFPPRFRRLVQGGGRVLD